MAITNCDSDILTALEKALKGVNGAVVQAEVDDKTTHVVSGHGKRTLKILQALARGCLFILFLSTPFTPYEGIPIVKSDCVLGATNGSIDTKKYLAKDWYPGTTVGGTVASPR